MITNLEHIGLSVSNLERSYDFYCKNLNCEIIRIIEANPELKLGKVVGLDGCSAMIAHLKAGENKIPKNHRQADLGFIHAGFTSTNVRDDYRRMKENGVRFMKNIISTFPVTITF